MPRIVSTSVRQILESRFSEEVNLIFLTITHSSIAPIYVVSDTKDYIYGGNHFIGFPFDFKMLQDDDSPPRAQISIQNVDQAIGEAIRDLKNAARLKAELLHSSQFDLTADPRTPIGTPVSIPLGNHLYVTNVQGDIATISGDLTGPDYGQTAWPGQRATEELLPGCFL